MPLPSTTDDLQSRRRVLHRRIARSRRRIDRRLRGLGDESRRLVDWRTYVVRYPGWALTAALGAGMTAAGALRPALLSRWLGRSLLRNALGGVRRQLFRELRRLWTESNPERTPSRDERHG